MKQSEADLNKPCPKISDDPLLETATLAAELLCTPQWLEKLRGQGQDPPFIKVGRLIRYRRSAVDLWLAARTHLAPIDEVQAGQPPAKELKRSKRNAQL